MKRMFVVLCLVLVFGACSKTPESYDSATAVAADLRAGDVICEDFETSAGAELVADQGSCSSGAEEIAIYVFEDEAARDRWLQVGARLDDVVIGPTWAVDAGSQTELVVDALGGEVR